MDGSSLALNEIYNTAQDGQGNPKRAVGIGGF